MDVIPARSSATSHSIGVAETSSSADATTVPGNLPGNLGMQAVQAGETPRPRRMSRGRLVRRMLIVADVVGLSAAFALTEMLFADESTSSGIGVGAETVIFALTLPAWILAAKLYGLYDRDEERAAHSTADELVSVFHLVTVVVWLYFAGSWIFGLTRPDQAKLSVFWLLAILGMVSARVTARTVARRSKAYVQNAVIVGAGDVGQLIGRKLQQHPEYRINLLGYIDASPKAMRSDLAGVPYLGDPADITEILAAHDVDRVIVAFSKDHHEQTLELLRALRVDDIQIDVVPRLYEAVSTSSMVHGIEGLPLLGMTPSRMSRPAAHVKRAIDIVGAGVAILVVAPLMLVIAALIRRDSPGPVLFRQVRLGMDMREFTILKFRTMRDGTDAAPHREYLTRIMTPDALPTSGNLYKLDRSDVVTGVGRWLRRTSLDELPQLLNVIRGDMSLVGPRPALPYELELYAPHHFERFSVPAGLTGLWQVEARAHSTFGEALDLDVLYTRSWSLGLDLRLLLRTPALMLRKRETS